MLLENGKVSPNSGAGGAGGAGANGDSDNGGVVLVGKRDRDGPQSPSSGPTAAGGDGESTPLTSTREGNHQTPIITDQPSSSPSPEHSSQWPSLPTTSTTPPPPQQSSSQATPPSPTGQTTPPAALDTLPSLDQGEPLTSSNTPPALPDSSPPTYADILTGV